MPHLSLSLLLLFLFSWPSARMECLWKPKLNEFFHGVFVSQLLQWTERFVMKPIGDRSPNDSLPTRPDHHWVVYNRDLLHLTGVLLSFRSCLIFKLLSSSDRQVYFHWEWIWTFIIISLSKNNEVPQTSPIPNSVTISKLACDACDLSCKILWCLYLFFSILRVNATSWKVIEG